MYMEVPQGFEQYYPRNVVLLLLKTLYGTKQAAMQFWRKLVATLKTKDYNRSIADACLYYQWTTNGLVLALSWVDDVLICGPKDSVLMSKSLISDAFAIDDVGEMTEYIGCKVEQNHDEGYIRLTQPVMLQSFEDEFDLPGGASPVIPAPAGDKLVREEDTVDDKSHAKYRSGVGKMLHMMKWSRPELLNRVRELSRYVSYPAKKHVDAMYKVMKYCLGTKNRGLTFKPTRKWNGDPAFEFVIRGMSDANFDDPCVSGWSVFLEDAPVTMKSKTQKMATISVTEAELMAAVECAQDMVFSMHVLESIGLKVQKPMVLEVDNKGAVDLANNWSAGGRTRHVCTKIAFLRELKEDSVVVVKWTSNTRMSSDIFTKNVGGSDLRKHMKAYVGEDEYD